MKLRFLAVTAFAIFAFSIAAEEQPTKQTPDIKPYGCFRDLRWGMTIEDAGKSLGLPLKKYSNLGKAKDTFSALGALKIGDMDFDLALSFSSDGLRFVTINPLFRGPSNADIFLKSPYEWNADWPQRFIAGFKSFEPTLIEKFGKPEKQIVNEKPCNLSPWECLASGRSYFIDQWTTEESVILLRAQTWQLNKSTRLFSVDESTVCDSRGSATCSYSPLLIYAIKGLKEANEKKTDL